MPPEVVQHTILIRDDATPAQQRPYDMNPKYETIVKEEIDKLLDAGFIYKIEHFLSPYDRVVARVRIRGRYP